MKVTKRTESEEVENSKPIETLVIDGNSFLKHYFHGVKNEFDKDGYDIGGVVGFLKGLKFLINQKRYDRVFVFWDGFNSGKLRYNFYKEYKANRDKDFEKTWEEAKASLSPEKINFMHQQKILMTVLQELSVRQYRHVFIEGDDLIAYYCLNKEPNENIIIVTKDRDYCQLIDDNIRIFFPDLKKIIGVGNFSDQFEHHIDNSLLIKVICGDDSDNVKGVKGVKEGTLLKYFPELKERKVTLEEILTMCNEIVEKRKAEKKPELKQIKNILQRIIKGEDNTEIEKEDLYEINDKLMNLKKPLLTDDCINKINSAISSPVDISILNERKMEKVYDALSKIGVKAIMSDSNYVNFFYPFKYLKDNEIKMYKEWKLLND